LGGVAPDSAGEGEAGRWSNGVFVVDPRDGLRPRFYRKQHLVPFGEYLPFRRWLPFLKKIVPIGGDFEPGTDPAPLALRTGERVTLVGTLICYEDVFPALARRAAAAGAEVLFVATNNGWFGETGAPYQHAAHSVLRAVETRRPVIRVGNGGWSGWIDEYGRIREVLRNERQSIYHRGCAVFAIDRDRRWAGRESLYVRWGDWFVWCSMVLAAGAGLVVGRAGKGSAGDSPSTLSRQSGSA
jgi:apolipoprotein N-acyltransferase